MFSIRAMNQEDMDEVLEMMKVFYASPAVLHKASEAVLRQDIEDCIGEMPYIEGYVFTERGQYRIEGQHTPEEPGNPGGQHTPEELHNPEAAGNSKEQPNAFGSDPCPDTERIAGYAMVAKGYSTEYGGLCLWVEDIYMKPEYRHKGLSSLFFSYLEKQYEGSAVRYRLEVEEENQAAVEAYRKNGFHLLPYKEMTKEV